MVECELGAWTPAFIYTLSISTTCHRFVSHHASLGLAFSRGPHAAAASLPQQLWRPDSDPMGLVTNQEQRHFHAFVTNVVALGAPWWGSRRFLFSHFLRKLPLNVLLMLICEKLYMLHLYLIKLNCV